MEETVTPVQQLSAEPSQVTEALESEIQLLSCETESLRSAQSQAGLTHLENLPGGGRVVHTLVAVLVNNKPSQVLGRVREHPGLEPVGHVVDVVEEDLVLLVDAAAGGVGGEPAVGAGQVRPD